MPRPLAVAAVAALALGAGVAPALAAGPTPLVRAIDKVQGSLDLTVNENVHTAAGDRKEIHALIDNAYACVQDSSRIARIPAIPAQQAGKAEWLSGERLAARLDVQYADAVYAILTGNRAAGFRAYSSPALNAENNRVNHLVAQAEGVLHVRVPSSPAK